MFAVRILAIIAVVFSAATLKAQTPEFEKDVLPIFQKHCFECHAGENVEGNLSLESLVGIRRGGHSGSPLLATMLDNSELHLRVVSTADGYRMPKSGPGLSDDEIAVLDAWIPLATQLLDSIPANVSPVNAVSESSTPGQALQESVFGRSRLSKEMYYILIVGLGLVAVAIWFVIRLKQTFAGRRGAGETENVPVKSSALRWIVRALTVTALAGLSAWSAYSFYSIRELESSNRDLQAKLENAQRPDGNKLIVIDKDHLPLPVPPMHPRRLGGQYYRGNDERSEELFNGGFYRTATIDLHLVDSKGERFRWGDDLDREAFVELSIRRSKEATKELFSPRTRDLANIEHYCQTDQSANRKTKFESVEEYEHWRAIIPLPPRSRWKNDSVEGMVYLMYGVQVGGPHPRPHFGARYKITLDGDKISSDSELWLGNMFTLGGRVLVPQKGEVLLDRWFDWRPIPEIEGKGATDPELLGLPEHQK